ncbi:MAG TPA: hypothetical protein VL463_15045 [Kofleriaceae bacterium]|nr:hypothetical protein [Kofleriaceae bacterium]
MIVAGAAATGATTMAGLALGARQTPTPWAPFDATSHIAWGEDAKQHTRLDAKHTLVGLALNAGAMFVWAGVHALLGGRTRSIPAQIASAAGVSAIAYAVDYHAVPARLTPGFEKRLNRRAVGAMFVVLAGALAIGGYAANALRG